MITVDGIPLIWVAEKGRLDSIELYNHSSFSLSWRLLLQSNGYGLLFYAFLRGGDQSFARQDRA